MLCVQAMEASFEKAFDTLESLNNVFSPLESAEGYRQAGKQGIRQQKETQVHGNVLKEGMIGEKIDDQEKGKANNRVGDEVSEVCFGFEDLNIAVKAEGLEDGDEPKTPERTVTSQELSIDEKKALENFNIPLCDCVKKGLVKCQAKQLHIQCVSASVAFAQFLLQAGNKSQVTKILNQLRSKYGDFISVAFLSPKKYFEVSQQQRQKTLQDSGLKFQPELLSVCLTASCIHAELQLHQKDFTSVHVACNMVEEMEDLGMFENVLHRTLLVSRLTLCEASTFILSSKPVLDDKLKTSFSTLQTAINQTCTSLEDVTISSKRKVSFGDDSCRSVKGKGVRDTFKSDPKKEKEVFATPRKTGKVQDIFATPKFPFLNQVFPSAKKTGLPSAARTPANRIQDLAALIGSDEEEDVAFPDKKPVTPSVSKSVKSKSVRARTEVKKVGKRASKGLKEEKIACKLDFPSDNFTVAIDSNKQDAKFSVFLDNNGELSNSVEEMVIDTESKSKTPKEHKGRRNTGKSSHLKTNRNEDILHDSDISVEDSSVLTDAIKNVAQKDVFNFSFEASPGVGKPKVGSKSGKNPAGVKKKSGRGTGATVKGKVSKENNPKVENADNDEIAVVKSDRSARTRRKVDIRDEVKAHENESMLHTAKGKSQRKRRNNSMAEDVETVRYWNGEENCDLDISADPIELSQTDLSLEQSNRMSPAFENRDNTVVPMVSSPDINVVGNLNDDFYEPVEIMRGGSRRTRKDTRGNKQKVEAHGEDDTGVVEECEGDNEDNGTLDSRNAVDCKGRSEDTEVVDRSGNGKEKMRSGRLCSVQEMSEKLAYMREEPEDICMAALEQGKGSFKESTTLLYEKSACFRK